MRRTAIVVAMGLLLTGAPANASALDGKLHTYSVDHLQADWTYPSANGHGVRWYVVMADVETDAATGQVVDSKAFAALGRCNADATSYIAHLDAYRVVRYQTDPLMQKTTLVLRRGSQTQRVHFTATTPSSTPVEQAFEPCYGQTRIAHQDIERNAYASGMVFGKQVWTLTDMDPSSETIQRSIDVCTN